MKHLQLIIIGIFVGAISWACSGWFSDRFEPFDSELGFILNQLLLSIFAIYLGYKKGVKSLLLFIFYAYIGLNSYSYIFGSSEQKALFLLGLFTTLVFLFFPLLLGFIAKSVSVLQQKYNKKINKDT
jgi:hypothetical protein